MPVLDRAGEVIGWRGETEERPDRLAGTVRNRPGRGLRRLWDGKESGMTLKSSVRVFVLGAAVLLLAACGAAPTPTPSPTPTLAPGVTPTATPTVTPDPRSPFEIEWDALVEKAQEEGQLDTNLSNRLSSAEAARALTNRFESEFGINMRATITGSSSQTWERISAERKAGKYTIDVWTGGFQTSALLIRPAGAMIPLKGARSSAS